MPPRIKALWLLAWALVRTLLRRAFGPRTSGFQLFQQNYAADGLSAVSEQERQAMPSFGRCVACGLCDRNDRARVLASGGRFRGTMSLIIAASRSMPDYRAAALGFAHLTDDDLLERESVCPTRVPMRAIARFVRAKAEGARVSAPASQGRKRMPSSMPPAS
jgi:succinate dehydrogenase/fumarate reductase-like Fe-S protein